MRIFSLLTVICTLLPGCTDSYTSTDSQSTEIRTNTTYLCVGMETSSRFGSCTGCALDSQRMDSLLKNTFGYNGVLLQSEQATRSAVVSTLEQIIKNISETDLFIFYYSGHGGREFLNNPSTSEPTGADSADEYLCLYDTYLLDDELWNILSRCKGRIFLIFDCCHSQTMFRSISKDFSIANGLGVPLDKDDTLVKSTGFGLHNLGIPLDNSTIRMLCWSGCLEAEYSYGSSKGGVMTNIILNNWKKGISYSSLWSVVEKEVTAKQPTQHPSSTQYGFGFTEAFR